MSSIIKQTDWPGLINRLNTAREAFDEAEQKERIASIEKTNVINRLNDVQKEFDAAVDAERGVAPRGTDWAQRKSVARAA